jgi:hypothetical protein
MRSKELKNELQIKSYNHGGKKTETSGNGWVENGRETNQLREGLVLFSLGFNGKHVRVPTPYTLLAELLQTPFPWWGARWPPGHPLSFHCFHVQFFHSL